jgi:hypothetical protein
MGAPALLDVGGLCPVPASSVGSCYTDCDQCSYTSWVWGMAPFPEFAGLSPAILVAQGGCVWSNQCRKDCDQCPEGTAAAWYVQVTDQNLPLTSAVLVPAGDCAWTSCCPGPRGLMV